MQGVLVRILELHAPKIFFFFRALLFLYFRRPVSPGVQNNKKALKKAKRRNEKSFWPKPTGGGGLAPGDQLGLV